MEVEYNHILLYYDYEVIIMSSKVQVNIDSEVKHSAEDIIKEVGLTPTAVINSMYKQIVATGEIPLSFSLTSEQMADLQLKNAVKKLPVKKLRTRKEIEDFFNDED